MYTMVKAKKPDLELPTAFGKKWTDLEEQQLLNELEIDMDCDTVAENHKRTLGGIRSRIYEMAYRMYLKNTPKEEIIKTMRLTEGHLDDIIARQTMKEDNKMKRKEIYLEHGFGPHPISRGARKGSGSIVVFIQGLT